jgi:hypothetical protein
MKADPSWSLQAFLPTSATMTFCWRGKEEAGQQGVGLVAERGRATYGTESQKNSECRPQLPS